MTTSYGSPGQPSPVRRFIGEQVQARLDANPRMERLPSDRALAYRCRDYLDAARCERLIAMIEDLQLANARIILSANRSAGWRPGSNLAHRQIFEALKARDGVRAATLLDQHIRVLERAAAPGPKAAPAAPAG